MPVNVGAVLELRAAWDKTAARPRDSVRGWSAAIAVRVALLRDEAEVGADDVAASAVTMARGAQRHARVEKDAASGFGVGLAGQRVEALQPRGRVVEGRAPRVDRRGIEQRLHERCGLRMFPRGIAERLPRRIIERR